MVNSEGSVQGMTEIRLDNDKIERIIAQVLRDQYRMLPAAANEAARTIGVRLVSSLPSPTTPALNGTRVINGHAPVAFIEAFSRMTRESHMSPQTAWKLAFEHAKEIPAVMADTPSWLRDTINDIV
jgi:hypothetical protein